MKQLLEKSEISLNNYCDYQLLDPAIEQSGGYFHVLDRDARHEDETIGNVAGDYSKASTSTVVHFLVASGRWSADDEGARDRTERLLQTVIDTEDWSSAGLPSDNAFTLSFMLELIGDLCDVLRGLPHDPLEQILSTSVEGVVRRDKLRTKLDALRSKFSADSGSIAIETGLPNAYSTQLVARVLRAWDTRQFVQAEVSEPWLDDDLEMRIRTWAMSAVDREVALATSLERSLDVFELGYALLLVIGCPAQDPTPEERWRLNTALDLIFGAQTDDGSWPQSRRLFHYPTYGNAYCYEYEFLTELIAGTQQSELLRPYVRYFAKAVDRLFVEQEQLPGGGVGWRSGHHRQMVYPESWSTASCFHFVHVLDRFTADAICDTILAHLGARTIFVTRTPNASHYDKILDSQFTYRGSVCSIKQSLNEKLIEPVMEEISILKSGGAFRPDTSISAILFGPPGTSKTNYVSAIANRIGWPLISINPSHLLRRGIQNIFSEVDDLFRMLAYAERVVVFFDEIDELVRNRVGIFEEAESRFLTTAMLPKIAELRAVRRVLFFVATNHLEVFDAAISRPGRFDLIVPIPPPTYASKIGEWPHLQDILVSSGISQLDGIKIRRRGTISVRKLIDSLTYDECKALVDSLKEHTNPTRQVVERELKDSYLSCVLRSPVDISVASRHRKTWETLMEEQRGKIRLG